MILMQLNGISKSFGADEILSDIKLEVKMKDRMAIVGRNGAGKSTLLQIMAGLQSYDTGEFFKPKDVSTGYLSQHTGLESEHTIWDEMLEVFTDILQQEKKLRELETKMANAAALSSNDYEQLLKNYDQLQHAFEKAGGYNYESEIRTVLHGLHFGDYDEATVINELSGGQKTRLALGKLLLAKPDILILDEPTNHLDIETLTWLEGYLSSYPGAVVIVSHDRYFLDKTVSIIYDVSRHHIKKYHGTYSSYLEQRALQYEQELDEYEKQQTEIKKMEDFIQKNIVRASTTKRAQSRRKQLEKMERIDKPLGEESSASIAFQANKRSGNDVLSVQNLSFRYDESEEFLFRHLDMQLHRGDRFAIVGPNGVGKTTLLKNVIGKLKPASGEIRVGTNVEIGYYDQEQADLSSSKTVLHELWDDYPTTNEKDIRTVLGNFLFSGDDVLKIVHSLSGGEKARLALSKLRMQKANLLVLDEPTNHLDIDSKEVLESALTAFEGTILFVSHDRYFINKIADHVVEMQPGGATIYLGDYDYYIAKKQEELEMAALEQTNGKGKTAPSENRLSFEEEKRLQSEKRKRERQIAAIEEKIDQLENELSQLEERMAEPEIFQDHEMSLKLTRQSEEIKSRIEEEMQAWEILQEE
ncbi:ABC-F family ATP-binding cassette domain-containing protein [Virgibacillus halophilus]|uniref:ABC-F family ATP-binding cassette domain-containing protein n=1 Tax=Tigheibacillus halophilus TaxID=361280 RepID=A0ABU5C806_9BACI|nr:ABC-F family ATP-binding cassette domain-containing protein [Virgibacillus halophilus]